MTGVGFEVVSLGDTGALALRKKLYGHTRDARATRKNPNVGTPTSSTL